MNQTQLDPTQLEMIEQIKKNFSDILTDDDLKLLENGKNGLDKIADKYHSYLNNRRLDSLEDLQ